MRVLKIKATEIGDIFCFDPDSTKYILKEIIDDKVYEREIFSFGENDTIVDVGANIGIFSLYMAKKLKYNVNLYSIEPIPQNYEILLKNINAIPLTSKPKLFNMGLADFDTPKEVEFSYFPNSSVLSTMDTSIIEKGFLAKQSVETAKIFFKAIKSRIPPLKYYLNMFFLSLKPVSRLIYNSILKKISLQQKVRCRISTLSDFIKSNGIQKIDFLKIDTEGAELKILHGLKPEDWDIIRQMAIEVHHKDLIEPIKNMLYKYGLRKIEIQEDDYMKTEIGQFHQIYAAR